MKGTTTSALIGETLTHIDIDKERAKILLTTQSGRQFLLHHEQDCCEFVTIVGSEGDWHALIGKCIKQAICEESQKGIAGGKSQTDTALTFLADDATVISRWVGESNGYYSESVDLAELCASDRDWRMPPHNQPKGKQ